MSLAIYQFTGILICLAVTGLLHKIIHAYKSPLSRIPGPWYAFLTDLPLRYGFSTGKIWRLAEQSHQRYGPIVRLGPRHVWVSDREAMKQILITIDLPKVAMYAEISRDRCSPGLFGEIRHDPHRRLKKFLSPAFTVAYIDNQEMLFKQCISDFMQKCRTAIESHAHAGAQAVESDLMEDLHNLALDIMGECSFGKGFGQTNPDKQAEDGIEERIWKSIPRSIFDGLAKRYQAVYIKRFLRCLGISMKYDWPSEMITAIDCIVQKRKDTSIGTSRQDLLQHLIDNGMKPESGICTDTRDIVDQMSEILLAGSETTSGTIACLFLELARNPDVKAKLLATLPIRTALDPIIDSHTIRNDPQYEYLNACIKENLRLHPIASEMGRRTGKNWVSLMGYNLPPHTVVSASYRDLHRNGQYWPEPLRFWPERWLSDEERTAASAPSPDGGKHSCIGINFAWAEMRMVSANFFSQFDLNEVPHQNVDFRQFITMQFMTGSWKALIKPRVQPI
ncbi:hypothetical protein OIDMADRAFT_35505 [Oidiodendron maius Zn]|uniref:Cytochrome P450 n=1 Tax=Oidiodendron maius (strain Zn) TaxID=913774 RepID=A0A0C3GBZ6_OIDMZ|nr:hypothetical protein OIDMADRAFT_35505 [Oidiodendron maius Zn]